MSPYGCVCWHMNARDWNLYPTDFMPAWKRRGRRVFRAMSRNKAVQRAERKRARVQGKKEADFALLSG